MSFQKFGDVTQIPEKLDMFVGKKFMFRINVDSRNVRGISSMHLATRMSDDSDLISHSSVGYETI